MGVRRLTLRQREALAFYLCISPWLLGFVALTIGPMLISLGLSFTRYNLFDAPQFVGLDNYTYMFTEDTRFWKSLQVTALYTLLYVPTEMIGGLALAMLMNQRVRGIRWFRTIVYLPTVLSGVAFIVVWMLILRPDGLINAVLGMVGVRGPRWLTDENYALIALWMMSFWGLGRAGVIYLAGLQNIPRELTDAAAIDGANRRQIFRRITIPLLSPVLFFNLVLSIIGTFQTFTSAFVATGGDPNDSTLFYVLYLYRQAFPQNASLPRMGYASALAWVLFVIIFVLTVIVMATVGRRVFYGGER